RAVANISSTHELQVGPVSRIESHRIMKVQERASFLDKINHSTLLLGGHPDSPWFVLSIRPLHAVAKDDQELHVLKIFNRKCPHVYREVRDNLGGLKDWAQTFFNVSRLVPTISN